MKIWVLFSIYNDYSQPEANLEAWWPEKPSIKTLAETVNIKFESKKGSPECGKLLKGEEVRIGEVDYRLEEIEPGTYERSGQK